MKCFNHPATDAVAVCRSCGRALCPNCVTTVDLSCSCKGRCETVVATLNELAERGRSAYAKTSAIQMRTGILVSLLGVVFLFFSIPRGEAASWNPFLVAMAGLFLCLGLSSILAAIRFKQR